MNITRFGHDTQNLVEISDYALGEGSSTYQRVVFSTEIQKGESRDHACQRLQHSLDLYMKNIAAPTQSIIGKPIEWPNEDNPLRITAYLHHERELTIEEYSHQGELFVYHYQKD